MDYDTLMLAGELVALAGMVALGIWRWHYNSREAKWAAEANTRYDMRRDGERQPA